VTRPLVEQSIEKVLGQHNFGLQRQEFMPGAFRWRTPNIDDPPPDGPTPELENGWAQVDPPLERFAYRLHSDGSLEFKGHLDAAGASSGTVALTLPTPVDDEDMEPSYRLPNDQFFHTVITPDSGATFQIALVFIESTTGEVTITWPAS
jgi:hypothetical protein